MSLVSIIIPYFKKKNQIRQTINSILKQKYKKFEILIIYDDTNHSELKFLRKNFSKEKKVKIFINKKNIGAGLSRNLGIKMSRGEYIAFIDADDLWTPSKLEKQIKFMKKKDINISHTSYSIIDEFNKKISFRKANNIDFDNLLKSCDIGLSTVIIKKKILKDNLFVNLKTKEDYVLWLKLSQKGHRFYALNKELTLWRKTPGSLSSSTLQKLFDGYRVYNKFLGYNSLLSLIKLIQLSLNYLKK